MKPERRPIFDHNGNEIGCKSVLFGELSDDYDFKDCTHRLSALNLTSELTAMNVAKIDVMAKGINIPKDLKL